MQTSDLLLVSRLKRLGLLWDGKHTIDPGVPDLASDNRQIQLRRLCDEQLKVGVKGGHLDLCIREVQHSWSCANLG